MGRRIDVMPGFCILWAFLILVLPLRMILAAGLAAVFHELCHILAIRLSGGQVITLTIGAGGMVLETTLMTPGREMLCALAGPGGSLLLVLLYPVFPLLAFCGLIQGCFNLLPIYPLDGGRALGLLKKTLQREGFRSTIGGE